MDPDSVFLTPDQALEAVCRDFRQYGPQLMLFCEVHRLLGAHHDGVMARDASKDGVWISVPGRDEMRWLAGEQLVAFMCRRMTEAALSVEQWAAVCGRVFQARACVETDRSSGQAGIRIQTGMEAFSCRQCGRCCRSLDYRHALSAADVARWQESGRTDILAWVGTSRAAGGRITYQMWLTPGTRKFAEVCPFLKHLPSENRWICQIHDVKPEICRNYPVSRKHAVMTGCPGFGRRPSKASGQSRAKGKSHRPT